MEIESENQGPHSECQDLFFKPVAQKSGFVIKHITKLADWTRIPVAAHLENDFGALVLKQVGPHVPILRGLVQDGLDLTVSQVKKLLAAHDIYLPGQPSKQECYQALIDIVAESEDEKKDFMNRSSLKLKEQDDGEESDYEELLNLVSEDAENREDPDIKQEKRKINRKKLANPKVPEDNWTLEPPKKGEREGKGKERER